MRASRDLAVGLAVVVALIIIVAFYESLGLRGSVATLIILPSAVQLGYYLANPGARDRVYNIGLYSIVIVAALAIGGLEPRLAALAGLVVVALLLAVQLLSRPRES